MTIFKGSVNFVYDAGLNNIIYWSNVFVFMCKSTLSIERDCVCAMTFFMSCNPCWHNVVFANYCMSIFCFSAGRPPWYNLHGELKEPFVIGVLYQNI